MQDLGGYLFRIVERCKPNSTACAGVSVCQRGGYEHKVRMLVETKQ